MVRIKFPHSNPDGFHESWTRAKSRHPEGAVSAMHGDGTGYWYTIKLP